MFKDTVVPKRCPVCASDCILESGLASDEDSPASEVYENYSCEECCCEWITRARLTWYESEVTHRGANE